MDKEMFTIGKVTNTHGVRGEIKVIQVTDFDDRFKVGNDVYWISPDNKEQIPLTIDAYRTHKNFHLLHFEGYDNINDVERFKGGTLAITKEQQTPLNEGEFYYREIIGCHVETTDGSSIGKVKEILSPGANDVWVIQRPGQKDAMIPYIENVVKEVDPENQRIVIEPMEGLLD